MLIHNINNVGFKHKYCIIYFLRKDNNCLVAAVLTVPTGGGGGFMAT
jgi:hypothetical protein